jgi:hypothetical protein
MCHGTYSFKEDRLFTVVLRQAAKVAKKIRFAIWREINGITAAIDP